MTIHEYNSISPLVQTDFSHNKHTASDLYHFKQNIIITSTNILVRLMKKQFPCLKFTCADMDRSSSINTCIHNDYYLNTNLLALN